jgi:hypothetical protein
MANVWPQLIVATGSKQAVVDNLSRVVVVAVLPIAASLKG